MTRTAPPFSDQNSPGGEEAGLHAHQMKTLEVMVEDARWHGAQIDIIAQQACGASLQHLGLDPLICEISLLACDDAQITTLNTDFRDKPQPTNVLSWPAEERAAAQHGATPTPPNPGPDGLIELGDIAISYDTCAAEASAAGKAMAAHVTHLIVHGVLHLLGYDHISEADADLMESIEVEILGKLGHDDPYSETVANEAALTKRQD